MFAETNLLNSCPRLTGFGPQTSKPSIYLTIKSRAFWFSQVRTFVYGTSGVIMHDSAEAPAVVSRYFEACSEMFISRESLLSKPLLFIIIIILVLPSPSLL